MWFWAQMTAGGLQLSGICLGTFNDMRRHVGEHMPHNSTMMALGSQVSLVTVGQLQFLCFLTVTGIAAAVAEAIAAAATVANIIIAL